MPAACALLRTHYAPAPLTPTRHALYAHYTARTTAATHLPARRHAHRLPLPPFRCTCQHTACLRHREGGRGSSVPPTLPALHGFLPVFLSLLVACSPGLCSPRLLPSPPLYPVPLLCLSPLFTTSLNVRSSITQCNARRPRRGAHRIAPIIAISSIILCVSQLAHQQRITAHHLQRNARRGGVT